MAAPDTTPLWIAGAAREAVSGRTFPTTNPATGEVLSEVQVAGEADVDEAVAAAREAQREWAATSGSARGAYLQRAAGLLRERAEALAELEVLDTGKPIREALEYDLPSAAECLEYFAGIAPDLRGEHLEIEGAVVYTRREPLGVCAGIGAWNYPLQIATWKAAPALACGNAMVFKPSELTPLTAVELARAFREAGLPDGLFQVLHGAAPTGTLLARHPGIAKLSLTGSVPTGKAVMRDAAGTLKRLSLELGGKSPLVIFGDADLEQAVRVAMQANFYTQGEVCSNGARVFVHRDLHDAFLDRLAEATRELVIGDPLDPATQVGSLISRAHRDRVEAYVAGAREEGARLVVGGRRPDDPALEPGAFYRPTVFAGCTDAMTLVREEVFGPVMAVLDFADEDEVVARANATPFGLAAGVLTRDLARGHRVAAALEAGVCWINTYNETPVEMPFGGVKQSGFGRENGVAAIEDYTQRKSVYLALEPVPPPFD